MVSWSLAWQIIYLHRLIHHAKNQLTMALASAKHHCCVHFIHIPAAECIWKFFLHLLWLTPGVWTPCGSEPISLLLWLTLNASHINCKLYYWKCKVYYIKDILSSEIHSKCKPYDIRVQDIYNIIHAKQRCISYWVWPYQVHVPVTFCTPYTPPRF